MMFKWIRYGVDEIKFLKSFDDLKLFYDQKLPFLIPRLTVNPVRNTDVPLSLQLEPTNYCNLRCISCSGSRSSRKRGFMDSGLQGSLQLQVMANETIGFIRAATRGVPVNDDTLALDIIDERGPTGQYLQHPHTIKHFKTPFYSKLFEKGTYSQWEKKGKMTMEEHAAKVVDKLIENHTIEPLPEEVQLKIKAIVEREQAWIDAREA